MLLSSQNLPMSKTGFSCRRGIPFSSSMKKSIRNLFSFEKLHSSSSTSRSVVPNPNPKKRAAPSEDLRETKKKIMKTAPVKKVGGGGLLKLKVTFRGIPVADLNLDALPPSLVHTAAMKNQFADNILFTPQKPSLVNNARDLQKIVAELDKKRQREEKEKAAALLKEKLEMERMQREKKQQQELEKKRQREERAALLREAQRKADAALKEKKEIERRQHEQERAKAAAVLREAQRIRDIELKEKQEVEARQRQMKQQLQEEKKRRVAEQRKSESDAREKMEKEADVNKSYCCILKEIGVVKRCEHAWCWGYPSSTVREHMGLFLKEEEDGSEGECDELEEGEIREI